jgi:bifunctional DNA-binding transcriptional regulator/antitoxin component of YhaV-PrlF toxin-antitoxin module
MSKIYKILGKRGRITIPFEIRLRKGFAYNDVVSFEEKDDNTVVIKREKICDKCKVSAAVEKEASLLDIINSLQLSEQKAVFKYLARKLTDSEEL